MNCKLIPSIKFLKSAKRLAKRYASLKNDLAEFGRMLMNNPEAGVSLGGKLRKVRMPIASKGRGKSGGARVITYVINLKDDNFYEIRLLDIYDKSERSTLTDNELQELVKACGL